MVAFDGSLNRKVVLAESDRAKDVAIFGWQRAPDAGDLEMLKTYREKFFVIAFGPRSLPELSEHVKLANAWIDTGLGGNDHLPEDGGPGGRDGSTDLRAEVPPRPFRTLSLNEHRSASDDNYFLSRSDAMLW